MTPSDYELVEQGYDPPRIGERSDAVASASAMTHSLEAENRRLREALKEIANSRSGDTLTWVQVKEHYSKVRFDARAALAAEPASGEGGDAIDDGKTGVDLGPGVNAATGAATQGEERVEEIVARCEIYEYSLPRDEQRALIASWRERGEALERLRGLADERSLVQSIRLNGLAALKDKP